MLAGSGRVIVADGGSVDGRHHHCRIQPRRGWSCGSQRPRQGVAGSDLRRCRRQHRDRRPTTRTWQTVPGWVATSATDRPSDLVVGDDVEVVGTVGRRSNVPAVRARSVVVVTWVLGALAFLVGGLLIHLAAPGWSGRATDSVRHRPFRSVLFGLIALLSVAALLAAVVLVLFLSAPDLAVAIVAVSLPFTLGAVGILGLGVGAWSGPGGYHRGRDGGAAGEPVSPTSWWRHRWWWRSPSFPWSDGRSSPWSPSPGSVPGSGASAPETACPTAGDGSALSEARGRASPSHRHR